jgi:hypothetical protein
MQASGYVETLLGRSWSNRSRQFGKTSSNHAPVGRSVSEYLENLLLGGAGLGDAAKTALNSSSADIAVAFGNRSYFTATAIGPLP